MTVITKKAKIAGHHPCREPHRQVQAKEHYIDWVLKGLKQWKLPEDCIEQWKAYKPALTHSPGHQLPHTFHSRSRCKNQGKHHILVCTNARPPGHPNSSCGGQGSTGADDLQHGSHAARDYAKAKCWSPVRPAWAPANRDRPSWSIPKAPWYSKVTEADVATILDEHQGGKPAERVES